MLPPKVRLVEVAPRDGLQNEAINLSVTARLAFIESLINAGISHIECGSFVSPRRVPQMASTAELMSQLPRRAGVTYSVLVPNLRGFAAATAANAGEIAVFLSASEGFSQANISCSVADSLRRAEEVIHAAAEKSLPVRGYVSCVVGCPYQGLVPPEDVVRVAEALYSLGCYEISLGDTIGVGTPSHVDRLLDAITRRIPPTALAVHFHDTYGQALVNIYTSLQHGI
ncbi:MAG TPA: hydroxymethylglutaryl-CoA lyase, partial [Bryobacteraceae bacterium]|nr:hydroxymethylglutaryl-CoA lyase [Bryobacteraceae bacterium]